MALSTETTPQVGGPVAPVRPLMVADRSTRRRNFYDRAIKHTVTAGGIGVIFSILAIFFVILYETYPLFLGAHADLEYEADLAAALPGEILGIYAEEYRERAYLVHTKGVAVYDLQEKKVLAHDDLKLGGATITTTSRLGKSEFLIGRSDGRIQRASVSFVTRFEANPNGVEPIRHLDYEIEVKDPIEILPPDQPVRLVALGGAGEDEPMIAVKTGPNQICLVNIEIKRSMMGTVKTNIEKKTVDLPLEGELTDLIVDEDLANFYAANDRGQVLRAWIRGSNLEFAKPTEVGSKPITLLGLLNGSRTLVVCDESGHITTWHPSVRPDADEILRRVYDIPGQTARIASFSPSLRDKGFVVADENGGLGIYFGTTGDKILGLKPGAPLASAVLTPKGDGILAVDEAGKIYNYALHNEHPEISWASLFGKIEYEGYEKPEYVWQSTGGTDDFETKYSLTPLTYGTIKGAFYALLFAIPMALLGALYTSQFMHPSIRAYIKPTIEVMAAMPSVVLGFIAGLWMAPEIEKIVPGLIIMPYVIAKALLIAVVVWRRIPPGTRNRIKPGTELLLTVPVVLFACWLSLQIGYGIEVASLGGDYRMWLSENFGVTYDQRNSMVVGFAMGFAVIPIIFTISEDSLSNVPGHLTAGSLALGATRWQTAMRIVLPTASPGIFSAIMVGFGRAVGETMIVLMATGNTPVMEMSPFNGFRALSANIAVELPEAPMGHTHYRVLFLAALLLFFMTFAVNTLAELVRLRLRKRYRFI